MPAKKLFTFAEITDDVPVQRLGVKDQLRYLIRKVFGSEDLDLDTEDSVTITKLELKANLSRFIRRATAKLRAGEEKSVTMSISSKFEPILDEVLESPSIQKFYNVKVQKPDVEYDVTYFIRVTLEVK